MDHVCDNGCMIFNKDSTMVCRYTGKCFHQFISANEFQLNSTDYFCSQKPAKKNNSSTKNRGTKRPRPRFDTSSVLADIEKLLRLLLYSKTREELNNRHLKRVDQCDKRGQRHHKKRRVVEIIKEDSETLCELKQSIYKIVRMVNTSKR